MHAMLFNVYGIGIIYNILTLFRSLELRTVLLFHQYNFADFAHVVLNKSADGCVSPLTSVPSIQPTNQTNKQTF